MAKEINDPDDLLECPYETAHMIRAKRMQYHLLKCRQNHNCQDMGRCPFNASHEVYKVELRYHMGVCEDRHAVQSRIIQEFQDSSDMTGCVETPGYSALHIAGDSWENEIIRGSHAGVVEDLPQGKNTPQKIVVKLSEEELKGLNFRQKRALYLAKKKEMEERAKREEEARPSKLSELPSPSQMSQSMALHQHHLQQKNRPDDMYQYQNQRIAGLGRGKPQTAPNTTLGAWTAGARGPSGAGVVGPGGQAPPLSAKALSTPVPVLQQRLASSGDAYGDGMMPGLIKQANSLNLFAGHGTAAGRGIKDTFSPLGAAPGFDRPTITPAGRGIFLPGDEDACAVPVAGHGLGHGAPLSFSSNVVRQGARALPSFSAGAPHYEPAAQLFAAAKLEHPLLGGRGRGAGGSMQEATQPAALGAWGKPLYPSRNATPTASLYSDDDDLDMYQDALSQLSQGGYAGGYSQAGYAGAYHQGETNTRPSLSASSSRSSIASVNGSLTVVGSWADDVERAYPLGGVNTSSSATPYTSDSEFQDAVSFKGSGHQMEQAGYKTRPGSQQQDGPH